MVSDARNPGGQPTKICPEIEAAICASLRVGASKDAAAGAAGIASATLYNWLTWGEDGDKRYTRFLESVRKAEAEVEQGCLQRIFSDKAWQSQAWVLERKWPSRWGQRKPKEESAPEQGPTIIHISTGDEKDTLIAQLNNRIAALEEAK